MTAHAREARLFAAAAFTPEEKRALADATRPLRGICGAGRFPSEQLYHITLHFFGQTSLGQVPSIEEAMRSAAKGMFPFKLMTGRAGTFGRSGASVLWLGVDDGADQLRSLQAALETALSEQGFPTENREFKAHITLAREVRLTAPASGVDVPAVPLRVGGITLMESTNASGRLEYVPLLFVPFSSSSRNGVL